MPIRSLMRPREGNGHATKILLGIPGNKSLADALRGCWRKTDAVEIGSGNGGDVRTASMTDVMERVAGIRYLVPGWIPFGMLTMLVGPPGHGKSAFALWLARTIITGTNWFNGTRGPGKPGYVLWCDTEGSAAITVQRIKDWGLPAKWIKVPFDDDPLTPISLSNAGHLERIEAVIDTYAVMLVVIDSLRGAHGGDENSSKVAEVLQALAGIAERTRAAVLIVHHTRKLHFDEEISADASRGSNAIVAMVRSQLGIDKPDKDVDCFRLQMLKENLGLKPKPVGFGISKVGLEFGLAPDKPRRRTERDEAADWLREHMMFGKWYKAGELLDDAKQFGLSGNAIQRAREAIGIVKPNHIRKTKEGWEWRLPEEH